MTIRVSVKNEDTGESRVISATQQNLGGADEHPGVARLLKGGDSTEFHVHDSNEIVIREVKHAPVPTPG